MKKTWFASSLVFLFSAGNAAAAAKNDVSNTTWNLTGKYSFTPTVSCSKGGGANPGTKDVQLNLKPVVKFNEGGALTWTNDALLAVGGTAKGTWAQKGNKLDIDFDANTSALAILLDTFKKLQQGSTSAGGGTANWKWSNPKYTLTSFQSMPKAAC